MLENGILTDFRTYMTGELFGHLRNAGSLSQVMPAKDAPETFDGDAFDRGVRRGLVPLTRPASPICCSACAACRCSRNCSRTTAPSYLSGLVVGAEMKDALAWLKGHGAGTPCHRHRLGKAAGNL